MKTSVLSVLLYADQPACFFLFEFIPRIVSVDTVVSIHVWTEPCVSVITSLTEPDVLQPGLSFLYI